MNRSIVCGLLSAMALTGIVGRAAAQGAGTSLDASALTGTFVSEGGCEPLPAGPGGNPTSFHRVYDFRADGTWRMVRTNYADPACKVPVVKLRLGGVYVLGEDSAAVAGAKNATLSFDLLHVTLLNSKAAPVLAGCGAGDWTLGEEKDVGGTGCPALTFKPLAECSVDHDIIQLRDGVLYAGLRPPAPGGMCEPGGRPTALQPTGVRKATS